MLTSKNVRKGQVSLLFIVGGDWQKEKTVAVKSEQRLIFFVFGFFHVGQGEHKSLIDKFVSADADNGWFLVYLFQ